MPATRRRGRVSAPARGRSTPGQSFASAAAAARYASAVSRDGILLVEDDDAIASGLVRVLDEPGLRGAPARARRAAALAAADAGHRARDPRPRAARHRRHRRLPAAARARPGARDPDPHRPRPGARRRRRASTPAPTTTWSSRSGSPSCSPACAPTCAASPQRPPPSDEPLRARRPVVDRAARRVWRGGDELDAAPEGVRPARAAGRRGRARGHARADHARGLGHRLARLDQDTRHARADAARQDRRARRSRRSAASATASRPVRRRLVLAIAAVAAVAVVLLRGAAGARARRAPTATQELLRLQRDTVAATRAIDLGGRPADPVELPRSRDALAVYDRAGPPGRRPRARVGAAPSCATHCGTGRPADATADGRLVVAVPLVERRARRRRACAPSAPDAAAGAARAERVARSSAASPLR